jgi:glycine/D-amino acid oxidase-like deaminating enzyme
MPAGTSGVLPESVDVAVIGAGFTGLSAARFLSRSGADVAVLEARTIAWGASSRNGGMVLTGLKLGAETLTARYGLEQARSLYAASLASIDCVERIVREESIDCNFARCGHLEVACKPSHFDGYARQAELIDRDFHHKLRIIPQAELGCEIGSGIYFGGMVDESSAGVNPARYAAGLAQAALRSGARVYEECRAETIVRTTGDGRPGFKIATSRGSLFARNVLAASGAYTSGATPALRKKIIPIGSYIIATEPLPATLAGELSPRSRMIYDSKHFLHYFRLTPDHRMLFGGRAAFFPETRDTVRRSTSILQKEMVKVYPQLRDCRIEYAWGGTLDFCLDSMPHAGEIDGVHFAAGFAGHGVAMATFLGEAVAAEMLGCERTPFADLRLSSAPFGPYNGFPWFLPFAGAYYKVLDWVS